MPAAAAAASRKRKQIDDMEVSPPKRVTRARAAKTTADAAETGIIVKKIATASARAAAAPKTAAKATRATKTSRVVKPDDVDMAEQTIEAPVKRPRGRPRKEPQTGDESAKSKTTAAKARAPKSAAAAKSAVSTRSRSDTFTDTEDALTEPGKKTTRGATKATATKKDVGASKKTTVRKKVTFEDESEKDKENVPLLSDPKSDSEKTSGMGAKPLRKESAAKAPTKASVARTTAGSSRGRKPTKKAESTPLSPKKVTQIAKSASSGSEDELCDRRPVRKLTKAPVKPPQSKNDTASKEPKPHTEAPPTPKSPEKSAEAPLLLSPAKRPPPSPFKDAIRLSPKKVAFEQAVKEAPSIESPFKDSLKASPKKVPIATIGSRAAQAPTSPLKASFLRSPAKRPASPEKLKLPSSPSKPLRFSPSKVTPVEESSFKLPSITPQRLFISPRSEAAAEGTPFPAGKSPQLGFEEAEDPPYIEGTPAKVAFTQYRENPLAAYEAQTKPVNVPSDSAYRGSGEYDSDDELINGTPTLSPFKYPTTPKAEASRRETLGITPLAMKLSHWYTSSPQKESVAPVEEGEESTPAPSPAPSDSSVIRHNSATPAKPSFFEEEMLVTDQEAGDDPVGPATDFEAELSADSNIPQDNGLGLENSAHLDVSIAEARCDSNSATPPGSNHTSQETISVLEDLAEGESVNFDEDMVDIDDPDHEFTLEASQDSQDFGDENAFPLDPRLFAPLPSEHTHAFVPIAQEPVTPARTDYSRPREVHTVCKVPLRAEGPQSSPIKVTRKRSRSTSAPLEEISYDFQPSLPRSNTVISYSPEENVNARSATNTPVKNLTESPRKLSYETSVIKAMMTPKDGSKSADASPTKSVRRGADARILKGAIVYVDVHTSEGAEASSLFVELLTQMGAKCVKQWNWNPRASVAPEGTGWNKVGITHVVFKDGGKRTLQKVREARGMVLCVGVGWVLDCERENQWVDEAEYAVDTSTIPRGGHNRRKSMEPRALSNQNGSLVHTDTPARSGYETTSPDHRVSFGASSRRGSIRVSIGPESLMEVDEPEAEPEVPTTPTPTTPKFYSMDEGSDSYGSPTTPYYLSHGAQLIQQTCPPKQSMQSLFPLSGQIEDQQDESVRQRLLEARRKSLQWAPKVKSPLGKAVTYGR